MHLGWLAGGLKIYHFYYLLAGMDLLLVGASLWRGHVMTSQFEELAIKIRKLGTQADVVDDLRELATAVNAPGNDVFDTRQVSDERAKQEKALVEFQGALTRYRELTATLDPSIGEKLRSQSSSIERAMKEMVKEAKLIFRFFEKRDPGSAGQHMASMDRKFAVLGGTLLSASQEIRNERISLYQSQAVVLAEARKFENRAFLFVILMVLAATFYGNKISKSFIRIARRDQQIRAAIDSSAIMSIASRDGKITEVNEHFCKISGYSRRELIGQNHRMVKSEIHPKEFYSDIWKTISSGKIWKGEIANKKKTGEIYWVYSTIVPRRNTKGVIEDYLSIRFDITELKAAQAKLSENAQFSALGEMAGGIAHEINNPLAIISGKAQLLLTSISTNQFTPDRAKVDLQRITETTERISKIIKGLRALSRREQNEPFCKILASDPIEDALSLCREKFKANGVKLIETLDSEPTLECRRVQFSQAVLNLLSNAYFAVSSLPEKWIEVKSEKVGEELVITVTDSGAGIPESIRSKVMLPFFTTKPVGHGTGLGLSLSKEIIEGHKGTLSIDAECSHTRFVIKVPLLQPKVQSLAS